MCSCRLPPLVSVVRDIIRYSLSHNRIPPLMFAMALLLPLLYPPLDCIWPTISLFVVYTTYAPTLDDDFINLLESSAVLCSDIYACILHFLSQRPSVPAVFTLDLFSFRVSVICPGPLTISRFLIVTSRACLSDTWVVFWTDGNR